MAVEKFEDVCSGTFLMTIDGPISAGKTTLGLALMKRSPGRVKFLSETGHSDGIVDVFLEDPVKYAAVFQMLMHGCCYSRHEQAIGCLERAKKRVCVIDRSLIGNMVFAVTNHRLGNIDDGAFKMYRKQNEHFRENLRRTSDLNVYLWVQPSTCVQRNANRNASDLTSESELEAEKYDDSYFWEVEKSAFVALLSDLTVGRGRRPLILDWHDNDRHRSLENFNRVIRGYLQSDSLHSTYITLSYSQLSRENAYTHAFDYSHLDEFFSKEVIIEVMSALAYTTDYDGQRDIYIQVPRYLKSDSFSDLFTLIIND